jgi:hypothetical protein
MTAKPIVVSFSEISVGRQCIMRHALQYRERWAKEEIDGARATGSAWHSAVMEQHYRTIRAHQPDGNLNKPGWTVSTDELFGLCAEAVGKAIAGLNVDNELVDLLQWLYDGYVLMWGLDPNWRILAVEHPFELEIPNETHPRARKVRLKGYIDLVVWDSKFGGMWICEHKSTRHLKGDQELELDDQYALYAYLLRRAGKRVLGAVYNGARTERLKVKPQPLDERFVRRHLHRSDVELANIAQDVLRAARHLYSKQVETEPYSSPTPGVCDRVRKCDYLDAHLAQRRGIDIRQFLKDTGFSQNLRPEA